MFNPFVQFHRKMIDGFLAMGHRYLVSQTHEQGFDHFAGDGKIVLLISDYGDIKAAQIHYQALTDKYRALLDLENEKHRAKIEEMLNPDSRYRLYAAFVEDMKRVEKQLNIKYSSPIRNYISRKTNWRIDAHESIRPKLELIFGELFIILRYRNQTERFRLADLEKY